MSTRIQDVPAVYGLTNLIANVSPGLSGWTSDPTTHANITDGDASTRVSDGETDDTGIFHWDLGAEYDIFTTGVGALLRQNGSYVINIGMYIDDVWRLAATPQATSGTSGAVQAFASIGGLTSQVRLECSASLAGWVKPRIKEFAVWKIA